MRAVTFDFWNTLFRLSEASPTVETIRVNGISELLSRYKLYFGPEQINSALEKCWQVASYNQRSNGFDIAPRGHINVLFNELFLPEDSELEEKIYQIYTTALKQVPPTPIQGIKEILEYLKDRYPLAVICNTGATPGIILREFMDRIGILAYFKTTVFSDEVSWAKPNTEIFRYTLSLLGVENYEAVHIGDDALTDVIGSRKAGMKAAWFAPWADWPVPECTWHIREMSELRSIL